ncbi:transposase [Petrocella sp. FN5]|uniref:transposase n=1 Tax=Petrocella sp. FN5 TaxID=3032002 RepID=UPI0023DB18FE|nr:transposase [Petrocella sp. FN5]MDF1618675.1 transposase [Petrocella sp. FN5]
MVDLETHRIIDILSSRELNDVKEWLETYPNLKVVSRDGSLTYASAITKSHPSVIQVSDRFHLIKGLSEAVNRYIIRSFPSRIEIERKGELSSELEVLYDTSNRAKRVRYARKKYKEGHTVNEISLLLHSSPTTVRKYIKMSPEDIPEDLSISREREHERAMKQKQEEVDEARALQEEGHSIQKIGIMMHRNHDTIKRWLNPEFKLINGHYDYRLPGKLTPFEKEVIELRSQGVTYTKIKEIIEKKGYDGSVGAIRMFMQKERAHRNTLNKKVSSNFEYVQRRSLCSLIYKKIEKVAGINEEQLSQITAKFSELGDVYAMIKHFYEIIFSQKADTLDAWMDTCEGFDIPEINTFLQGTKKDLKAVKNGIRYRYNNGLAEGSVNKIKVIKRIMYGRNSFALLKAKVLLNEIYH